MLQNRHRDAARARALDLLQGCVPALTSRLAASKPWQRRMFVVKRFVLLAACYHLPKHRTHANVRQHRDYIYRRTRL